MFVCVYVCVCRCVSELLVGMYDVEVAFHCVCLYHFVQNSRPPNRKEDSHTEVQARSKILHYSGSHLVHNGVVGSGA